MVREKEIYFFTTWTLMHILNTLLVVKFEWSEQTPHVGHTEHEVGNNKYAVAASIRRRFFIPIVLRLS